MHFSLNSGTLANAVVYDNLSRQLSCKFSDAESRIDLSWAFKSPISSWATFIFLYPLEAVSDWSRKWSNVTAGSLFGHTGNTFLLFGVPIVIIAFLAIAYLIISGEEEFPEFKKKVSKIPRFSLWTFPVLVDGPFGVVSAAEMIGLL
ncbi:unnamed protein product [Coffea canephora]|uniref:Uncharacterized protein n=1 Tax=Coffea canephora TaxID=49390 RepID=A0A068UVN6_COFCA|nr:unnamed protein product [Coffea canephora]